MKENSTKGTALVNPITYKGDVLVQVWCDSRVLATLVRWLEEDGVFPRFMSQVVRRPLEILAAHVVDEGEVEMVDDTAEARGMLERRFGVKLNKGGRGKRNELHNKVLSTKRGAIRASVKEEVDMRSVPTAKTADGKEIVVTDELKKYMKEFGVYDVYTANRLMIQKKMFEENEKKRMMKEEMKRARECGVIVESDEGEEGDNNVGGIREGMSKEELDRYEEKREREVRERENREFRMEDLPIVKGEGEDGE
jgi:hypothetical protein